MLTDRGLAIVSQMDGIEVDWRLVLGCLQSSNLFEQGVSFEVLTGKFRGEIVPKFPNDVDVPILLLDYLLNCIEADLTSDLQDQYYGIIHDKGEAFLALRIPLDPWWKKHNCELAEEKYFQRIAEFLLRNPNEYQDRLATHVLEAWSPKQKPFSKIMKFWKSDPVLKMYVEDLEAILQCSF